MPVSRAFHFIAGLPRSGSTLLAGILRQNPRFHAGMSSPVAGLINGALEQMGAGGESAAFFDEAKRNVKPRTRRSTLRLDLFNKYQSLEFRQAPMGTSTGITAARRSGSQAPLIIKATP